MKTSNKILATIALTGVLGTGLYAFNNQSMMKEEMMQQVNPNAPMQMKQMMHKKHKKEDSFMRVLSKINLTQEQEDAIAKIKQEMFDKRVMPDVAFTKEGFDKAKFIELMKQKRENMLESKAEMIDRVYQILTPKQKEQIKVLMELKKENMHAMMDKRMNFDKNCDGRR